MCTGLINPQMPVPWGSSLNGLIVTLSHQTEIGCWVVDVGEDDGGGQTTFWPDNLNLLPKDWKELESELMAEWESRQRDIPNRLTGKP